MSRFQRIGSLGFFAETPSQYALCMHANEKVILIGCGTGRCGTVSLSRLVDGCVDATCTHERRPLLPKVPVDAHGLLVWLRSLDGNLG